MTIRSPAVAGTFYPASRDVLTKTLDQLVPGAPQESVIGILAPHAGYMYSGSVAGAVYARVDVPEEVLILSPNHTGYGPAMALWPGGSWITPLGPVPISPELTALVKRSHEMIEEDTDSQEGEHAAEVQVPFLQRVKPDVSIAVLTVAGYEIDRHPYSRKVLGVLKELGESLGEAFKTYSRRVLIVASSDMNHYEPDVVSRGKDVKAIEPMLTLDPAGLFDVLDRQRVSMCGYAPAAVALVACKKLGATKGTLVQYRNSAETSGDFDRVVGYAGIMFQ